MPRPPKAQVAPPHDIDTWDAFAAAALTGFTQRGNQNSKEVASASAYAADRLMEEREKRFGRSDADAGE